MTDSFTDSSHESTPSSLRLDSTSPDILHTLPQKLRLLDISPKDSANSPTKSLLTRSQSEPSQLSRNLHIHSEEDDEEDDDNWDDYFDEVFPGGSVYVPQFIKEKQGRLAHNLNQVKELASLVKGMNYK